MTIPTAAELQNASGITVEAWLFPGGTRTTGSYQFINKGDGIAGDTDRAYNVAWIPATEEITWNPFIGTSTYGYLAAPLSRNQWTHFAATYDQAEGRLSPYTNGVLAATTTNNAGGNPIMVGQPIRQTTLPLVFGTTPGHVDTYAEGMVDEVRIWSYPRSGSEIQHDFACELTGQETGLEAYWDFENGTAADVTGHGHDGTLSSGASINDAVDLVQPCGQCIPHPATATVTVVNGFVVGATLTDGGCGYTETPVVVIRGSGTGATATATITDGVVTGITITNAGSGYGDDNTIQVASPPFMPSLEIAVSKVMVTLHVVLGKNYVLESSADLTNWEPVGPAFTAEAELLQQEFDVAETGRYFRIQEVP